MTDKKRVLLTDIVFPNKYARWRLTEIYNFMNDYDTDIMVINRINSYAGNSLNFDFDILCETFNLHDYNILIFNPAYNYINKYNSNFEGTKYNNKLPCDYILQKKKFENTIFSIETYDLIYHIFLMNYTNFNEKFLCKQEKQFIHLYPGGGFINSDSIHKIYKNANVIPSQQFISKLINENSYLNIYGGPFFTKEQKCNQKNINDNICICFTSLGDYYEKGADTYVSLVNKFYENYYNNNTNYSFISIGKCLPSKYITHYDAMDQEKLSYFYNKNVDILISLDSGIQLNGFPLGIEGIIEGCILLTTDVHNQNKLNNFNLDDFFIINRNNIEDIIKKILFLKDKSNRLEKMNILQNKIYNLFNYNHTHNIINKYINTMEIYNSLVQDSGGACSAYKFMYIYNNFIRDKNIKTIVEIGVYNGCFLLPITHMNNNTLSYGIDPYESYIQNDIEDKNLYKVAASISTNADFLSNVYNRLINNIDKFKLNVNILRNKSENVVNNFDNNSIDILNIDGSHDYEFVLKDLYLYSDKITTNGIIIIDDINWPSVKSAMDTFLKSTNKFKIIHVETEWGIIQKYE
jgi:Ca2+-binding EF-hand superfamily protein